MSQAGIINILTVDPQIPTQIDTDSGSAIPIANVLEILGDTVANGTYATPLFTTGSGNTVTINAQVGAAITGAPADKNDAGLVSFDDTMFTVDANGYVQFIGASDVDTATANFIVDPTGEKAEYTTITDAINAASAGDTIFIKEGTYTEDLTVDKKLTFAAYGTASRTSNVTIKGTWIISVDCTFIGLILAGNGTDPTFQISANITQAQSCKFSGNSNGCISMTGGEIRLYNSNSDGGKHFSLTGGSVICISCYFNATSVTSTVSAGSINFYNSNMTGNVSSSGTGGITIRNSYVNGVLTCNGSGTHNFYNSIINSGSNASIDVGATATAVNCSIVSSNTNPVTGSGTIQYAGLSFGSTGKAINTTTQTILSIGPNASYSGTGSLGVPSGTTAQRPGSPANGMIRYNTTLNTYEGYQSSGATWLDLAGGGSSPLTTKGDLYTYSTADARLAVGSDGTTLIADSAQTTGNKWGVLQEVGGGTAQSSYTTGDLLYASATDTLSKLSVGAIPGVHLIVNDSGVPQWDTNVVWLYEDFLATMPLSTGAYRSGWFAGETGSANLRSIDAIDSDHPGCYQFQVSANGDDALLAKNNPNSATAENCIKLGGGYLRADFLIKIDTLATATEDFVLELGLGNPTQFGAGSDKIYLSYNRSTSTDWQCITTASSSSTTGTGGSSVSANTNWTQCTLIVNADATSVSGYIDGVLVGTSTTNIPTAAITPYIVIRKTATATSVQNNVYWDVFRLYQKLTNSRLS